MTKLPVIYKLTNTGKTQQWQIIADGDEFYTIEGLKDGKLTTSKPTKCLPKNIGKKNATSAEEQAMVEAKAKFQKKLDKGYSEDIKNVSRAKYFEPMLARDAKESKDLDFKARTFVQPKLDGLRCVNQDNTLMSRNGKPYVSCPHLQQNTAVLDGELYTHLYHDDFNAIVSLCKQQKPTEEELKESAEKVEFWAYDFPGHNGVFSERYEALKKWRNKLPTIGAPEAKFGKSVFRLVPTHEVKNWHEIKEWHGKFLEEGYEGTIIRIDLGPYENKRSKQLLKYKDFVDEEFEIVGAVEGEGGRTGTIGKFWMRNYPDKPYSIEDEINVFKSNVKGNFEYLRKVWVNRESYIGKQATVKYFNRTPLQDSGKGDVPRFGYVIKIDRESYE